MLSDLRPRHTTPEHMCGVDSSIHNFTETVAGMPVAETHQETAQCVEAECQELQSDRHQNKQEW